jgi:hypothetical protein
MGKRSCEEWRWDGWEKEIKRAQVVKKEDERLGKEGDWKEKMGGKNMRVWVKEDRERNVRKEDEGKKEREKRRCEERRRKGLGKERDGKEKLWRKKMRGLWKGDKKGKMRRKKMRGWEKKESKKRRC